VSNESKVYVINPSKTSDLKKVLERTLKSAPETNGSGRSRTESDGHRNVRIASTPAVLLSYLLGPLAILMTREGRRSRLWVALAVGSVAVTLSLLWDSPCGLVPYI